MFEIQGATLLISKQVFLMNIIQKLVRHKRGLHIFIFKQVFLNKKNFLYNPTRGSFAF